MCEPHTRLAHYSADVGAYQQLVGTAFTSHRPSAIMQARRRTTARSRYAVNGGEGLKAEEVVPEMY